MTIHSHAPFGATHYMANSGETFPFYDLSDPDKPAKYMGNGRWRIVSLSKREKDKLIPLDSFKQEPSPNSCQLPPPECPYSTKFYIISKDEIMAHVPKEIHGPFFHRLGQVMRAVSAGRQAEGKSSFQNRLAICEDWPMWNEVAKQIKDLDAMENTAVKENKEKLKADVLELVNKILSSL